jgi:hypothetical protein
MQRKRGASLENHGRRKKAESLRKFGTIRKSLINVRRWIRDTFSTMRKRAENLSEITQAARLHQNLFLIRIPKEIV